MELDALKAKIENREAKIAVIGLGYVGLPVATLFADKGFNVLGVEIKSDRVEKINAGICPIEGKEPGLAELLSRVVKKGLLKATTEYDDLFDRDVILIDVETPVDEENIPRYEALSVVLHKLDPVLKKGAIVIVESTVAPGTMENFVLPMLEKQSGKKLNTENLSKKK